MECTNWRGITLLSVSVKVFSTVLLRQLKAAINKRLREEHAGFRKGSSCSEHIFTLRNIIEYYLEYKHPLSINFIDFRKAFDSVHRESLWNILQLCGVPMKFIAVFQSLYNNSSCCVRTDTGHTDIFGVRQGCILSSFLFMVALDFVMRKAMAMPNAGIDWDGSDLDFADDIALLTENGYHLQEITSSLYKAAEKVRLRISAERSKVMHTGAQADMPSIKRLVNSKIKLLSLIAHPHVVPDPQELPPFIFRTQIKIFLMISESSLTLP